MNDEPLPRLSLLIDDSGVWVEMSVISDFRQVKRKAAGLDYTALASTLSAFAGSSSRH